MMKKLFAGFFIVSALFGTPLMASETLKGQEGTTQSISKVPYDQWDGQNIVSFIVESEVFPSQKIIDRLKEKCKYLEGGASGVSLGLHHELLQYGLEDRNDLLEIKHLVCAALVSDDLLETTNRVDAALTSKE